MSPIQCSLSVSTHSKTPQFDLKTYWTTLILEINQKLDQAVPIQYPDKIYEAMRYSVLAKGAKRAPPVMCVAACELFGGNRHAAFPTACALEMVHSASLIHDDLPCMDDDPSRRGQPSNHKIYGVDMAILAGDALFPLGFRHIVSHTPSDLVPEPRLLSVIAEIARAVGSTGMAAGSSLTLREKKFGEMGECSAVCGGLLAGAKDDEIQRLRRYGRAVGVLYQVVDDILEAKTMKSKVDEDKKKKKGKSYVALYGVEKAIELAEELRAKAKKELDGFEKYGESVLPLYSFVDYAADRGFSFGESISVKRGWLVWWQEMHLSDKHDEMQQRTSIRTSSTAKPLRRWLTLTRKKKGAWISYQQRYLETIVSNIDVASICSVSSTCKTFNACASQILTFIPSFDLLDIAPSIDLLRPLLPPNPYLKSLKLIVVGLMILQLMLWFGILHELYLHNCADFSGKLLYEIGGKCADLRYLYLGSVAEKRGRAIHISDLEELLRGCTQLEALILMFDVSLFLRHNFALVWALVSEKLTSLEIGYVSSVMVTELVGPSLGPHQSPNHVRPSILPGIQKLCLSVDYITDTMVSTISKGLMSLTHLDLRDAPLIEPTITFDLTNSGLQQINQHGKLKHLSLVRSQEFTITYFRRVNDLGMLLMADKCANMESICLGGFCRVTDTGFKQSCIPALVCTSSRCLMKSI
ncbi:hypothetical protein NC652_024217 [Populus alba x Populus x berolinensis]|nr:hypothetical protein NC652_024217 [Populus alba x Populus x berolinensis]